MSNKILKPYIYTASYKKDWSFKEEEKPTNSAFVKSNKKKKKKFNKNNKECKKVQPRISSEEFYKSDEWRSLRYRVLKKYDACCMACGRSKKIHNVVIHVDHIKPRSTHPHLQLAFENLQVLCEDCNLGKMNRDEIDYRPTIDELSEIQILLAAGAVI